MMADESDTDESDTDESDTDESHIDGNKSPGFSIRKATVEDMPVCARVLAPAFADKVEAIVGDMEISLRIIPTVMELMDGEAWVAVSVDDEVVGAIIITTKEPKFLPGSLWICLKTMGLRGTIRAFSIIRDYIKSAPGRLEGEGILEAVGVPGEWGGRGIGAALVNEAADYLKRNGLRYFGLGVKSDSPAVRLYEKMDFERKREYSNRLGHWLYMQKEL